jgi:hypothetical protein
MTAVLLYSTLQTLLAEERRLSGLRTELSRKAEIAAQTLAAKERQVDERLRAAAGNSIWCWRHHAYGHTRYWDQLEDDSSPVQEQRR